MKFCCCRICLRTVVKIIAAFEMIVCVAVLIPITLILLDVCFGGKLGAFIELVSGVTRTVQFPIWLGFWTIVVVKFILDINLYRGANNKNYEASLMWLIVTAVLLISCYLWSLMSLNIFKTLRGCLTIVGANIFIGIYKGLEMVAVYNFMHNLKKLDGLHLFTSRANPPISISDIDFNSHTTRAKFSPNRQSNNFSNNSEQISHVNDYTCECDGRFKNNISGISGFKIM